MNKLDELILALCPDGVEYVEIEKVFDIKNGYTPSKSNSSFWENGTIPWFRMDDIRDNGRVLSISLQQITKQAVKGCLFPADSLIVSTSATIGEHALITVPFLANQRFTCLTRNLQYVDQLDPKFMLHWGFILSKWCKENTNTASFASVDMQKFRKVLIPVPPIQVQQEIVRILDQFTELTTELTTELELRKKQYDYYRNELLTFDGVAGVTFAKLGEVVNIERGVRVTKNQLTSFDIDKYPVVSGGTGVMGYLDDYNRDENTITVAQYGSAGYVNWQSNKFWANDVCYSVFPSNIVENRFVYHFLMSQQSLLYSLTTKAIPDHLPLDKFSGIIIPIPPLAEQQRIVDVLDRFDALCNDLSSGLPAEINARKKQYEYYRDTLLSFEEKVEVA